MQTLRKAINGPLVRDHGRDQAGQQKYQQKFTAESERAIGCLFFSQSATTCLKLRTFMN